MRRSCPWVQLHPLFGRNTLARRCSLSRCRQADGSSTTTRGELKAYGNISVTGILVARYAFHQVMIKTVAKQYLKRHDEGLWLFEDIGNLGRPGSRNIWQSLSGRLLVRSTVLLAHDSDRMWYVANTLFHQKVQEAHRLWLVVPDRANIHVHCGRF